MDIPMHSTFQPGHGAVALLDLCSMRNQLRR
jgi:hypothetical protein